MTTDHPTPTTAELIAEARDRGNLWSGPGEPKIGALLHRLADALEAALQSQAPEGTDAWLEADYQKTIGNLRAEVSELRARLTLETDRG
jgi:hypothetical protein